MGINYIFYRGWKMKRFLIICLVLTACMSSCTKLIKNENAIIEHESESMSAKVDLDNMAVKGIRIFSIADIQGIWVGYFNAKEEFSTKEIVDKGKTAWHKEHKITVVIDSVKGSTITGYSIIAGITKNIVGTLQEDNNSIVLQLTEKGKDSDKGTFNIAIRKKDSILQGNWTADNTIDIPSRICRFTKKSFSYNPNIEFIRLQGIKEDEMMKSHVDYLAEYNEWYEAVGANYDIVNTVNPSSTLLNESHVEGLTRSELMLLRNTIFARHGYAFKKRPLRIYFEQQPWYIPVSSNPKAGLTTIEQQNIALILRYERNYGQYDGEYGR